MNSSNKYSATTQRDPSGRHSHKKVPITREPHPFHASTIRAPSPNTAARLPPWPILTASPVLGALEEVLVLEEVDVAPDDDDGDDDFELVFPEEVEDGERAPDVVVVLRVVVVAAAEVAVAVK